MNHYLIAAALIFSSIVLYIIGQQGYAILMIGGLVFEMAAAMIATKQIEHHQTEILMSQHREVR